MRDLMEQHPSLTIHLMWVLLICAVAPQLGDQGFEQFLARLEERVAHDDSVIFELRAVREGIASDFAKVSCAGTGHLVRLRLVVLVNVFAAHAGFAVDFLGVELRDVCVDHSIPPSRRSSPNSDGTRPHTTAHRVRGTQPAG
jgi:hypothetical protein